MAAAPHPLTHPPMQRGWIDALHRQCALGDLALDNGDCIRDFVVSYVVHGPDEPGVPTALGLCAIGSTHHRLDFLIGPGAPLDTNRMRVIVVDAIGNGLTTSPSTSLRQPGMAFPGFTIGDMVRSQKLLLERLGVERLEVVIGASMGGMQALEWGVRYPEAMARIVALVPLARTPGWTAAINHAARQALAGALNRGASTAPAAPWPPCTWDAWVTVMQLLAVRTPAKVNDEIAGPQALPAWLAERTAWWTGQGFDPIDWIYQSRAYDAHNVGHAPGFDGNTARALQSIRARTLIVAAALDLYNPGACAQWAAAEIPGCRCVTYDSPWGHMLASAADGATAPLLGAEIRQFLGATDQTTGGDTA